MSVARDMLDEHSEACCGRCGLVFDLVELHALDGIGRELFCGECAGAEEREREECDECPKCRGCFCSACTGVVFRGVF